MFYDKNGKTMGENVIDYYAKRALYETEANEIIRSQKMYDYLKNDSAAIRYHLREYLSKILNSKTLETMPLIWLNEVPRVVKRLCLVYKKPAIRTLNSEALTEKYKNLTKSKDRTAKEFHKQGKLFNTILVRPIYSETKKQLDYLIVARNIANVDMAEEDPYKMQELRYQIDYSKDDDKGTVATAIIHWTDEQHWATDVNGNNLKLPWMPEDKKNPYKRIPFEILRFEECSDFWGDGMPDLVEGQEALNARLSDMFFKLYMSFGQAVGVNLGIKLQDYSIGPDKPILVDGVKNDNSTATPSLTFSTPEHKAEFDKEVNNWFKDQLANTKGLPSNGIRYTSGYDREVDNLELLDINEDDQETLRDFEQRLFDLEKLVLKTDANIDLGSSVMDIQFYKIEFPLTESELWNKRDKEYTYNISTPVNWLKEKYPQMDEEQIKKMLQDNRGLKIELGADRPTLFELANNRGNA